LKYDLPVNAFYLVKANSDKDIKEMTRSFEQLNFTHNTMIKIQLGQPLHEGQYQINLYQIALRDGPPDSQIFTKDFKGSVHVSVTHTGKDIRDLASKFVEGEFMLRNPNYDIG
jgi:hypothetical protein